MRLDQELVKRGLCESRTEAQECITKGYVRIDNQVITKRTRTVTDTTTIEVVGRRKFVSRGGEKLEGALLHIVDNEQSLREILKDRVALDIGSSTGGFTDCLLHYGIKRVVAIDVGTSQLHIRLRNNPSIELFENTDIRDFKPTQEDLLFDIIVADVSFIPLDKIFDTIISLGKESTKYFLLIKPQFEVGVGNTKKGIVKDEALVDSVLTKYQNLFKNNNFLTIEIFPSALKGGDGNQEYFIYAQK